MNINQRQLLSTPEPTGLVRGGLLVIRRRPLNDARFWLIQIMVVALVAADAVLGAKGGEELEFAPIVLLAFPVVYAALSFGREGGISTGVWSATLVLADLALWYTGIVRRDSDIAWQPDTIGAVMLVALGVLVGWRVDRERLLQDEIEAYATRQAVALALQRSEEHFYQLMHRVSDVVMVMAADGTIRYQGPSDESVLGYGQGELLGKNALELIHPDDLPVVSAGWEQCVATPGHALNAEFRMRHRDGSWRAVEAIGQNCLDDPDVAGVIVTSRDITERKEAEVRMEALRSEFFGMVSHELRTPVTVIKGLAEVELRRSFDAEEARDSFADILRSANVLQELAENVLDMSRIEAGAFSVDPEPLNLRNVVVEARDVFYQSRRARDVEIHVPDDLPIVLADERRIIQVVLNLLDNAAKFSAPSTPILLDAEPAGEFVAVHVRDQGRGIAPEDLPRLFKKFSQVHADSGRLSGSGLGLAICKGIIEAHGGRIWAESPGVNGGCMFSFTVPLAKA